MRSCGLPIRSIGPTDRSVGLLVKDRYGEPERGEWMGADKNSSRRRWKLQQDEHGFQHTSPTHYPNWPSPRSHWSVKNRYGEPERGEWMGTDKNSSRRNNGNSNKMNAASNTRLRLTTQVGQAHVATGMPLDLGTNTQPSDPRTQRNTEPRVYRPTPIRPVPAGETRQLSLSGSTPVRPVRHTG
jgi:hypothetical protein